MEIVSHRLGLAGWVGVEARKVGEVEAESVKGKDAAIVGAFEAAVSDGCGLVLYEKADE